MSKNKKSKKCSKPKRTLWYGLSAAAVFLRALASFSLLSIALSLTPLEKEANSFNDCFQEVRASGRSSSEAFRFCKGLD